MISIDAESGSSEKITEIGSSAFEIFMGEDGIISMESFELFLFEDEYFRTVSVVEDFRGTVGVLPG